MVQNDQVTRELKRTPYRPMMSLLASRERFCLHADVRRADDKAAACADATHVGKGCCTHLEHAESIQYPHRPSFLKHYKAGGNLAVYDIGAIAIGHARIIYVGKYQTCMVYNGRLIPHAS